MHAMSKSFHQRIIVLGIIFLREISCQEFPIIHMDPIQLSSFYESGEMMKDLADALLEVQPILLQTFPDRELYHLHHPSRETEYSTSTLPNKIYIKHSSDNVHQGITQPAIVRLPNPRPQSSKSFGSPKELGPMFLNPSLSYGFVPRARKIEYSSPKHEKNTLQSRTRNFSAPRLNSEISSAQNLKLQKTERDSKRGQKAKSKQISALRDPLSHISNRDAHYRITFGNRRQHSSNSKDLEEGKPRTRPHRNFDKGQESIRRPTTLLRNSQTPVIRQENHYKQEYPQLSGNSAYMNLNSRATTRRPVSLVNFALKFKMQDGPIYKIKDTTNESLVDQPTVPLQNPKADDYQLRELEKKGYLVLKPPALITTKRPSSAPFTTSGFFRNVPQSSPRDLTALPPKYSTQVSSVFSSKTLSTPSRKPIESTHGTADNTTTTIRSSNERNSYQINDLKDGKTLLPYDEHTDEELLYDGVPFGDVADVYSSQVSYEYPRGEGVQKQNSSSFRPISPPQYASYVVNNRKPQLKKSEVKKQSPKKSFNHSKSKSLDDDDENKSVPGKPGTDYPTYHEIPQTKFDCKEVRLPGFYADVEAGCQVFHNCYTDLQKHSFLCPNGTVFRQELFICDWWYNVRCEDSPAHFPLDEGQR